MAGPSKRKTIRTVNDLYLYPSCFGIINGFSHQSIESNINLNKIIHFSHKHSNLLVKRIFYDNFHKIVDTCGVSHLHGIPGIFGGLAAIFVVRNLDIKARLLGILFTVVSAALSGLLAGKIISLLGTRQNIYDDALEFDAED